MGRDGARVASAASVLAVVVVVAGVLAVAWAAAVGPSEVVDSRTGDEPTSAAASRPTEPTATTASPSPPPEDSSSEAGDFPAWVNLLVIGLASVLAGTVGWMLFRTGQEQRARRRLAREYEPPPEADIDPETALRRASVSLTEDAEEQQAALASGTPRNAVVACWQRLEDRARAAGFSARRSDTSTEFATRLLERASADPAAVQRLARLYREARFSDHELTEQHRTEAAEALGAIHVSLRDRMRAGR